MASGRDLIAYIRAPFLRTIQSNPDPGPGNSIATTRVIDKFNGAAFLTAMAVFSMAVFHWTHQRAGRWMGNMVDIETGQIFPKTP